MKYGTCRGTVSVLYLLCEDMFLSLSRALLYVIRVDLSCLAFFNTATYIFCYIFFRGWNGTVGF